MQSYFGLYFNKQCLNDGLCVPHLRVRCLHPPQKAAGYSIQVSSHASGAPWYMRNVQIHEDLEVPFFAEHIRALTESYDSKLAGVGNPCFQELGSYLR
jgi:hypothetical protein